MKKDYNEAGNLVPRPDNSRLIESYFVQAVNGVTDKLVEDIKQIVDKTGGKVRSVGVGSFENIIMVNASSYAIKKIDALDGVYIEGVSAAHKEPLLKRYIVNVTADVMDQKLRESIKKVLKETGGKLVEGLQRDSLAVVEASKEAAARLQKLEGVQSVEEHKLSRDRGPRPGVNSPRFGQ